MPAPQPCPHCSTLLVAGARPTVFCPGCGTEVLLAKESQSESSKAKNATSVPVRPAAGGPPIPFQCGRCGQPFQAASQDAGKRSQCPSCGTEIVVPTPAPTDALLQNVPVAKTTQAKSYPPWAVWLLVALALLAVILVWWSWWGLLLAAGLLITAWGLGDTMSKA